MKLLIPKMERMKYEYMEYMTVDLASGPSMVYQNDKMIKYESDDSIEDDSKPSSMKISHTEPVSLVVSIAPLVLVIHVTNINGHVLHLIHIRVHLCTMNLEELSNDCTIEQTSPWSSELHTVQLLN